MSSSACWDLSGSQIPSWWLRPDGSVSPRPSGELSRRSTMMHVPKGRSAPRLPARLAGRLAALLLAALAVAGLPAVTAPRALAEPARPAAAAAAAAVTAGVQDGWINSCDSGQA